MFHKILTEIAGIDSARARRISHIVSVVSKLGLLSLSFVFLVNLFTMTISEIGAGQDQKIKNRKQKSILAQKRNTVLEMRRIKYIEQMPDFEDAVLKANGKALSYGEKRLAYEDENNQVTSDD